MPLSFIGRIGTIVCRGQCCRNEMPQPVACLIDEFHGCVKSTQLDLQQSIDGNAIHCLSFGKGNSLIRDFANRPKAETLRRSVIGPPLSVLCVSILVVRGSDTHQNADLNSDGEDAMARAKQNCIVFCLTSLLLGSAVERVATADDPPPGVADWSDWEQYRHTVAHPATVIKSEDLARAKENVAQYGWDPGLCQTVDRLG